MRFIDEIASNKEREINKILAERRKQGYRAGMINGTIGTGIVLLVIALLVL